MASRAILAALAAGALALAGCGGDDSSSTSTVPTVASTPGTPTQVTIPATTPTETTPPTETAPAESPETQEGGAGDEGGMRVPASFTFAAGGSVSPSEVEVPAFFQIELIGVSKDGKAHTLEFQGETLKVPAGGTGHRTFTGLKAGRYPVTVDGREGAATIVSGADAGP